MRRFLRRHEKQRSKEEVSLSSREESRVDQKELGGASSYSEKQLELQLLRHERLWRRKLLSELSQGLELFWKTGDEAKLTWLV